MDKVLYVDDEKGLLDIGKIFLEENGQFSVRTIDSAAAALSLLQETDFDAIVSDFQMPGMDGIAFLKAVREQYPDIPFILFTGRGREEVVIEAINHGADFYLQKGGDPTAQFAELAHKIWQAVTRRRAQDELRAAYQQLSASDTELREQYRQLALSEQRIRDREKKFRAIFEKTHDALVLFNRHGCIDCNQKAIELFGYASQEEFLGLTPVDTSPPFQPDGQESRAAAAARMENVFEKGTDNFEWVQMRKDGSTFLADVLLSAFELDEQQVFLSSIRDITDRHRAEEELKQSRERLQLALWGADEGLMDFDIVRNILTADENMAAIHGYHLKGFPADPDTYISLIHPDDRKHVEQAFREYLSGNASVIDDEYRFRIPDGEWRWIHVHAKAGARDSAGKALRLVGTHRDVTRLHKVEEELRLSEELYHVLVAHIQDGVFLSQDGIVRYSNQILASMLGYSVPEPGMPVAKFVAPEYRARAIEQQQSRLAGKAVEEFFAFELLHKDGTSRVPVMISVGIGTYQGRPAIIGTVRDMSKKNGHAATIP